MKPIIEGAGMSESTKISGLIKEAIIGECAKLGFYPEAIFVQEWARGISVAKIIAAAEGRGLCKHWPPDPPASVDWEALYRRSCGERLVQAQELDNLRGRLEEECARAG